MSAASGSAGAPRDNGPRGGADSDADPDVVGSVDGDGDQREYVIADITADGAWLAMDFEDAPTLPAWR